MKNLFFFLLTILLTQAAMADDPKTFFSDLPKNETHDLAKKAVNDYVHKTLGTNYEVTGIQDTGVRIRCAGCSQVLVKYKRKGENISSVMVLSISNNSNVQPMVSEDNDSEKLRDQLHDCRLDLNGANEVLRQFSQAYNNIPSIISSTDDHLKRSIVGLEEVYKELEEYNDVTKDYYLNKAKDAK